MKNKPHFLFSLEMADDFLKADKPYTVVMFGDDNEGYSLGYITSVSVRATDSGIIVEFDEFDMTPFYSQTREYRNLKGFLMEYMQELIKPKKV
ncbi:hypothetical protein NCCP2222_18910 [Sporosarcina sp. NCCP-2222]|uniref:hypothetical protein n=1 Tax=Sporosarcina sp. NCCP-2222 TaxID=2935073 RepID=UPI002086D145|nr:hypothetical protein [Sporosarcina sp. NCCP-2222]GKV55944.1 hypothetical protein NCCP2222_18910 [Sporosarcina sp. NCCP-2222]